VSDGTRETTLRGGVSNENVRPRTSVSTSRVYLGAIVATAVAMQLWMAHRYFGFLTGDDTEVLCEAFRVATGYRYQSWEIRNLFVPDCVVAPFIWLAAHLGVHHMRTLAFVAAFPMIAASAASVVMVHRIALRWGADARAALVAAGLFAFHWIPFAFGSTVFPRTIATACVLGAVLLIGDGSEFVAGLLVGVAFADRFSEIVFLVPLLLIARRRLALLSGAVTSIALTCGVFDAFTRPRAFDSVWQFARVTLVENDFASRTKFQPAWWYVTALPRWCALTMLPLVWVGVKRTGARTEVRATRGELLAKTGTRSLRVPRRDKLVWFVLVPIAVLSLIAHKELRYLQGVVPFLCILAAIGFMRMDSRRWATALVAISVAWNLIGVRTLQKKTMPAVMAAEYAAREPSIHGLATSQLWAYGDGLFLGGKAAVELGIPPTRWDKAFKDTDAVAMFRGDMSAETARVLAAHGYTRRAAFADGDARVVWLFTPSASGTSGRARR
jgi:hypothetical protein